MRSDLVVANVILPADAEDLPSSSSQQHSGLCCWELGSLQNKQLSYSKQIARKLCTHYVEGTYDNPVTLKSRLRVTGNGTIG